MKLVVPAITFFIAVAMAATAGLQMARPIATSPWLMPLIVTIAMAIVSAAIFAAEYQQRASQPSTSDSAPDAAGRASPLRVASWLALSAGYAVATPIVGFEWATGVFLVFALKAFGGASWRTALPIALAMALLLPMVFRRVFFTLVP
jgi:hypothetical protein